MTRSYKKIPIIGIAGAESEKWYKQKIHRRERVWVRGELKRGNYDVGYRRIRYNSWDAPKDGKTYIQVRKTFKKYGKRYLMQLLGK